MIDAYVDVHHSIFNKKNVKNMENNMKVKIMIDSASDVSEIEAKELGLEFVPIQVRFEDEEYFDGVDLLPKEFYEKLVESKEMPQTSLINEYRWDEAFASATKDGSELVVIALSSKLSGTYQSALEASKKYNGKVWFGSFEEVSLYVYQYENSKLEYVACDKDSMTFKITTDASLDKEIFNVPMSAKVYLPTYASTAYYVIDGVEYDAKVEKLGERKRYVNLYDIPTDGTEVKLYFSGNKETSNGCYMHTYEVSQEVESTCTTHGFVELECTYCHNKYKRTFYDLHNYSENVEVDGVTYEKCSDCDHKREVEERN